MANPQDPSVHRSGTIGALAPDSIEAELEAHDRPEAKGPTGPLPPDNRSPDERRRAGDHNDDEPGEKD